MRMVWLSLVVCFACGPGCFWRKAATAPSGASAGSQTLIVTPETGLSAQVVRVNLNGRYVVLTFPVGQIPQPGRLMSLYRRGLKVGEVKITDRRLDDSVVADISAGEAQVGDDARDR